MDVVARKISTGAAYAFPAWVGGGTGNVVNKMEHMACCTRSRVQAPLTG